MDFNSLNYFQLDNLIRTRTSFIFLTINVDLAPWYGPLERMHLQNFEVKTTEQSALNDLNERKVPKDFAVVVLCETGDISKKIAPALEAEGYKNIYYIGEGYQGLLKEKGVG